MRITFDWSCTDTCINEDTEAHTSVGNNAAHHVQIIGCGSTGKPDQGGSAYTFNTLYIDPDGHVECKHHDFTDTLQRPSAVCSTAPYEVVRSDLWEKAANDRRSCQGIRCRVLSKVWEVLMPQGDLVTTQILKGLRNVSDIPQDCVELFT